MTRLWMMVLLTTSLASLSRMANEMRTNHSITSSWKMDCPPMVAAIPTRRTKAMVKMAQGGKLGSLHSRGSSEIARRWILPSQIEARRPVTQLDRCQNSPLMVVGVGEEKLRMHQV